MIDFRSFFSAVRARDEQTAPPPYPWQIALAERLAAGDPPRAISVPTGCGKTATIEALVWALCRQADRRPHERTVGVRTVWAIDRRILVDEVHEQARHIADRLRKAREDATDVLHDAAQRLASYTGGHSEPLNAMRWRGQVRVEPRAHHPLQPQLITSTIAQVGSRLLFRGYGVGERSLALEAALAGVDCNICLDEAHLT
jgi:CRISPR-associated endonuclease/helicase Cas3